LATVNQSICVPDACSLLFSEQVELEGKAIFDWLLEQYQVYICPIVKQECFEVIQKQRVELDAPYAFKHKVSAKLVWNKDYAECLKYLDRYCTEKELHKFSELGEGERESLALSLHLSLNLRQPVVFLTDDFEAMDVFAKILVDQKFAIQKSVPDIIINLFQTNLSLQENKINGALSSYYNIMRKAIMHPIFRDRMKFNCRSRWSRFCASRCI
jgi:hypothetical protein